MNAQHIRGVENTPTRPRSPKRSSIVSQQQSLNHLLNFSLPPRVQHVPATPRRSKKSQHVVWNSERFINAQYRFVMRPTGDYTVHFADPDIYFQWQDIVQVIIACPSEDKNDSGAHSGYSNCPICLSPPVVPRMTRCGHIFCYPCILHYIETGNTPKWHRCPICFDSITAAQLKPVRWSFVSSASTMMTGDTIPMRLIRRPHITNMALPRSDTWQAESQAGGDLLQPHEAPFHFLPDIERFARFMLASPEQLILDITREIGDLDREASVLVEMGDELGVTFVLRAREKCVNALMKAQEMEQDAFVKAQIEHKRNLLRDTLTRVETSRRREIHLLELQSASSTNGVGATSASLSLLMEPQASGGRSGRNRRNLNPPPHSSSSYYFYQAASGANVFLHPLDIRILLAHFGSYASFPDNISAVITHVSESTVDDDLRRRCKYLGHLPEGADAVFLELDLENVVGKESLKPFENLLRVRRTRHKERMKKEEKARLRAEERERDDAFSWIAQPVLPAERESHSSVVTVDVPELVLDRGPDTLVPAGNECVPRAHPGTAAAGVWGARSFASAVQSTAQSASSGRGAAFPNRRSRGDDDWEIDQAWHELEEAQSNGGRSKRSRQKKLVLLGSGGGSRRF